VEIVREVMLLVLLQSSRHYFHQLSLTSVVDLPNLGLYLMEPHFNRVQLWRVSWKEHHVDVPLLGHFESFFLVVNCTVVHYQPFLSMFFLIQLVYSLEYFQ
jgi:hypothetical protein